MTGRAVNDLLADLREHIGPLLAVADAVALLDMLSAFAYLVSISDTFSRPEFSQSGPLAIRQGRHPMSRFFAGSEALPCFQKCVKTMM